jgi:hypothetical protein
MRKFVASAAIAASAAAIITMTPFAAHAALPGDGGEIRTGCPNGITGYYTATSLSHPEPFSLVAGSEWGIPTPPPGIYTFTINQPGALESYGPALDSDKSFGFETQRVEKAVVNQAGGSEQVFFNDKANNFSFNLSPGLPGTFSVFYQCGAGRS